MPRAGIAIERLGLMMAGQGFEREPHAA
jgi:hypothetical protein